MWTFAVVCFGFGAAIGILIGIPVLVLFFVAGAVDGFRKGLEQGWEFPDKVASRLRGAGAGKVVPPQ